MKIKIGVIGGGFGARIHVPAIRLNPDCEVRALWSRNTKKGLEIAKREKIPLVYSDWKKMLNDSTLDALTVAVPPFLQVEIIEAALRKGKPLFLEKPLSANYGKAKKIMKLHRNKHQPIMMDFEFTSLPTWIKAKSMLSTGAIGRLREVIVVWRAPGFLGKPMKKSWKDQTEKGGGLFYNFSSHVFNYLEFFLGPLHLIRSFNNSSIVTHLVSKSGVKISCFFSRQPGGAPFHGVWFVGEKGTLKLESHTSDYVNGFYLTYAQTNKNYALILKEKKDPHGKDGRITVVGRLVNQFVRSIRDKKVRNPSLKDGLRVEEIMAAAVHSSRFKQWVPL